ncbi:fructosamine kinase family protein [Pararhodonellum marinum]|uniref:fructosamine kinase family protein n=1 Tax=Pararhodonellum marinum TaxID=2755358 RepID=UPI00188E8BCA|nr:fructosamine kinase family protein [Pararhodonellum marinum]
MRDPSLDFDQVLRLITNQNIQVHSYQFISSGNINQAVSLKTSHGDLFLKSNFQAQPDIFEKEIAGLELLRKHSPLTIPKTLGHCQWAEQHYLAMEWIKQGRRSPDYWQKLAQGMAQIHFTSDTHFGLNEDNYIAILPQINSRMVEWPDFFWTCRLEPLAGKAYYEGLIPKEILKSFQALQPKLSQLMPKERPALIHGDLWSGNILVNEKGDPALIDPAVYFGHREMDLAFSLLFGGFEESFYETYQEIFPMEPGFEDRVDLYNIYPLLVHLHLFGKSYLPGINRALNKYLH